MDLEGSCGRIPILFQYLPGKAEEKQKNCQLELPIIRPTFEVAIVIS
jgi:hypothetical protein